MLFFVATNFIKAQANTCPPNKVCLENPIKDSKTPQAFIGQIIKGVLGIVGSLALVMFIYGGLTWMTSSGNTEKVTKGKNIIIWASIGLVVIFTSYILVKFVIDTIK